MSDSGAFSLSRSLSEHMASTRMPELSIVIPDSLSPKHFLCLHMLIGKQPLKKIDCF